MGSRASEDVLREAVAKGFITEAQAEELRSGLGPEEGEAGEPRQDLHSRPTLGMAGPATVTAARGSEGARPRVVEAEEALPVPGWDRYMFVAFVAEGGMGRVYKAFDPRLKRVVALKFLRGDDPEAAHRFLMEAQAQARVEHEHICQIYEADEACGKPYIAMQFIEGKTLGQTAKEMTLEQKVLVIRDVAEAVHEAHRLGLIHRDIKPGNVMVERSEEGWKPFITDFGLAREMASPSQTMAGLVMGTPEYMAPEQTRGDTQRLDRRTDVYAIGVTLHELLAGRPPFEGTTSIDVLIQVLEKEPVPLRRVDPSIPADLETIVAKCLEKEPQRRYDSAKALAEDLGRFLDGEPVLARRAGPLYRFGKWARKNRLLVGVSATSLAVVLVLVGMWWRTWWAARQQAEAAQRFGQAVERVEGFMRSSSLLPLHDTGRERGLVAARIKDIRRQMDALGRSAEGPGLYAVGRGYMALREYQRARAALEKAWDSGYRTPEVAYALGQTLGVLYRAGLDEAQRIPGKEAREARVKEIERSLRNPALGYLRQCEGAEVESPALLEGQMAYYDRKYERAAEKAREAFRRAPWLFEAKRLEGDALLASGRERQAVGDLEGTARDFEGAGSAYAAATEIARSDSALYTAQARRWTSTMHLESMGDGKGMPAVFERALSACDDALKADPGNAEAFGEKSKAYFMYAREYEEVRGEDPRENLGKAIALAERAVALNPRDENAHLNLGSDYIALGTYQLSRGQDPTSSLVKAVENYQRAIRINPNFMVAHRNTGVAKEAQARWEMATGKDPKPSLDMAIENYRRAVSLSPEYSTFVNMANTYLTKGLYELQSGKDPRSDLDLAIENYRGALRLNPNVGAAYNNLGGAYQARAEYERAHGLDPTSSLELGLASIEKAAALIPNNANIYNNLGAGHTVLAQYADKKGQDPKPQLDRAEGFYQKALALNPNHPNLFTNWGASYAIRGDFDLEHGRDPSQALEKARGALKRASAINPSNSDTQRLLGECDLMAARWAWARGASPGALFDGAAAAIDKSLALNPKNPEAHVSHASLHRRRAEYLLSKSGDLGADVREGLAAAGEARSINPQDGDASAQTGALYLVSAKAGKDPARVKDQAARASQAFDEAFRLNPLLRNEYGKLAEEARGLARIARQPS